MKLHKSLLITFLFLPVLLLGQVALEPGFTLLEQGKFAAAEHFFAAALEQEPANRTAAICYGRAVGLNGNPTEALFLFNKLLAQSPNNQEIMLNIAEALMWDKQYAAAETSYDQLLAQAPENFTANLGAANARASQQNYGAALHFIQQALHIQPTNTNALISKKFILLGLASQEKSNQHYALAHQHLDTIEVLFPGDLNARLLRADLFLANQEYREAQTVYQGMVADSIALIRAYNGLSYTAMVLQKKNAALNYAKQALGHAQQPAVDSSLKLQAGIQFVNTLGINRQFSEAFRVLDSLQQELGPSLAIRLAIARLNIWDRAYKTGVQEYELLLAEHGDAFDLLMGLVDVSRAQQRPGEAIAWLAKARQLEPNQPDALRLWQTLLLADQPAFQLSAGYHQDNGGNLAQEMQVNADGGRWGKWYPTLRGSHWQAYAQGDAADRGQQQSLVLGTQFQWSSTVRVRGYAGPTRYQDKEGTPQTIIGGELGINALLGKYHYFDVAVSRDLHNYTADLVRQGILRNHLAVTYNFNAPARLGLFAQYLRTTQSDGNSRNLVFASLYFKILEAPILKTGINYNVFGFARQEAEAYFSPPNASAAELFFELANQRTPRNKWFYQAFLAVGVQRIATNATQQSRRAEFLLGRRLGSNLEVSGSFQAGNTAQSSISGYAYQRMRLQIRYQLPVRQDDLTGNHPD